MVDGRRVSDRLWVSSAGTILYLLTGEIEKPTGGSLDYPYL
jgi:hypothetical protein